MMSMIFQDREQAGRYLAEVLINSGIAVVFGIARGGVVIAGAISKKLDLPLGVVVVRKLGLPFSPELAFGAIGPDDVLVLDHAFIERVGISSYEIESVVVAEKEALVRRLRDYDLKNPEIQNKKIAVVDDGVATGATAQAAIRYLKKFKPKEVVFASPVCAPESVKAIRKEADIVCLKAPENFLAVGQYYYNFEPVSDEVVVKLVKNDTNKL